MTKKNKRIILISIVGIIIAFVVSILLTTLSKNIMFFMTPSEIKQASPIQDQIIRVGGLVKKHSLTHNDQIEFILTDCKHDIKVCYKGLLPSLFREGQGIIAIGIIKNNILYATELLAKHDEKYIPKELYKATIDHNSCNI